MTTAAIFNYQLLNFSRNVGIQYGTVVKVVSLKVFKGIIFRTPVDTGRAEGNWTIGVNSPGALFGDRNSEIQQENQLFDALSDIEDDPFSLVIIQNNLPYIVRLENGYSRQAPMGMVALTIQQEVSVFR